jgi:hypothetical protein
MYKVVILIAFSLALQVLISTNAVAYDYPMMCSRAPEQMPIKYWINYDSFKAPNCAADFTSTEIYYLILNSFITWEQYTGARFAVKYMGNSSLSKTEWAGDENEILFVCEEAGGGALGSYYKTGSDWCGNAVIVYDDDVDFAPQFSGGWGDNASTILIHEIGHLLGFHHTLDPCAIMFPDVANIYPEWGEVSALRNAYGAKSQNIDIYSRSYNTTAWNYYLPLSDTLQAPAIEHDPSSNICIAWQDATAGAFTPIKTTTYPPLDSSDAGTYTYHSIGLAYSSEYDYYLMLHVGHHNWDQDRQVYYQTSRDCENWSTWYEVPTDSGGWPTTSSSRPGVAYNSHEDAFYVILPYYYPFCGQLEASSGMGL